MRPSFPAVPAGAPAARRRALVVVAHPDPASLCHALARTARDGLAAAGAAPEFVDLHADGFDPRLTVDEARGRPSRDPLVARYTAALRAADVVTVVHPNLVGAAHPFRWGGAWASAYVAYRYTNTPRPSRDPQAALYWGRTLRGRWDVASTAVAWTQNKNRGDTWTDTLRGKRAALGARVIVSENAFAADDRVVVYPALGVRRQF